MEALGIKLSKFHKLGLIMQCIIQKLVKKCYSRIYGDEKITNLLTIENIVKFVLFSLVLKIWHIDLFM